MLILACRCTQPASGPSKGRLTLGTDGSFNYRPRRNFRGTDSISYTATHGVSDSNVAAVTIKVRSVRG